MHFFSTNSDTNVYCVTIRLFYFLLLSAFLNILVAQNYDRETKLTINDAQTWDYFGSAVSIDGSIALIGSAADHNPGKAFVFQFDGNTWVRKAKLIASDGQSYDYFGRSVALKGDIAVVGSPQSGEGGGTGQAYIYEFNGSTWSETQKLTNSNDQDRFGHSLDFDGQKIIIGSLGENIFKGAAYIYSYNGSAWVEEQKLEITDGSGAEEFGASVAISGNVAMVSERTGEISARLYIYEYNGTSWEINQIILDNEKLFTSIDIDGDRAVLSTDSAPGYILSYQDTSWVTEFSIPRRGFRSALSGDKVIIGDPWNGNGKTWTYWLNDSVWTEYELIGSNLASGDNFGSGVAIHNNEFFVGASRVDQLGMVYVFDLLAKPLGLKVSNGQYNNRSKISWKSSSDRPDGYKIFRDNIEIASITMGARAYYDYEATPGKIHTYSVMAFNNNSWGGESPRSDQLGWRQTNGKLEGNVQTLFGAGVDSIKIDIIAPEGHLGSSLQFDDDDDFVILNPYNAFPDKELTISFWLKTTDVGNTHPFSYASSAGDNSFLVAHPANLNIWIEIDDNEPKYTGATGVSVNDGQWHHLAITWKSSEEGELTILKDGIIVFSGALQAGNSIPQNGVLVFGQDQDAIGGGFDPSQAFNGLLDEVRIWNKARAPEDIQKDMYSKLKGDEPNLVSYWPFDDLPDRAPYGMTGDFKKDGKNHAFIYGPVYSDESSPVQGKLYTDNSGIYGIDNIYYGQSAQFTLIPSKWGHHFDPEDKTIELTPESPVYKSVTFIDTTALTIIGKIEYAGTNCSVPGVELFLDGTSTRIFTDATGEFKIPVDQPGVYDLEPLFGADSFAHKFKPAHTRINVEKSILDLQFADTTRRLLYGKFSGVCESEIGTAKIILSSLGTNTGCFKDTIKTDENGNYNITLPAQPYTIELLSVDISGDILYGPTVLQYFGMDTVDLTWQDKQHNFVYREELVMVITGWPDKGGGDTFNVPIAEQGVFFDLDIEVWEALDGNPLCLVNQGSVTIYDEISDIASEPVTLELVDGMTTYTCRPGLPNFQDGGDYPFQKVFDIKAHIGEEIVEDQQMVVVTGGKQRESEFYTIPTPEIAFWVLNDPPGDQSYSYFTKDSTFTKSVKSSWHYQGGGGIFADLQIGLIAGYGWSAGVGAETTWSTDFGIYAIVGASFQWGRDRETTHTKVVSFTASEEFRTSDSDKFTGEEGDVYIGSSFNDQFALADILKFDWTLNKPDLDTALVYLRTNFGTDFIYTELHIMKTMVPQLKELSRIAAANGDNAKAKTYRSHAESWERQVFNHHQLKSDDNPDTKLHKNYTFSSGTYRSNSFTTHPLDTSWLDFDQFTFDYEGKWGGGFVFAGCTYELGFQGYYHTKAGTENETKITTTETYGYVLSDDDPGDNFTVDVRYKFSTQKDGSEQIYGPPIFNLVSGVSSNPWEKGSQARDGVRMAINKYSQYNIQPDELAPFILYLGNTSESGEEREYHLSVIQSSNLDGAIIRVGGVVIEDHLSYTIPAGQQLNATMSIERGPIAYDYENLKIKFYAPGDEENIADTLTFSVHYISPCSNVNLLLAENNWVLNSSDNDTMQFVINDYDAINPHLRSIKFQYRRRGEGWSTAFKYLKENISGEYILEYWNINHLPDGDYELRAVSDCGQKGVKYSAIAEGVIDRSALIVFGTPEPSDGVLNLGEDISFSFSGEIDPAFLTVNSATLKVEDDTVKIEVEAVAFENKLIITPQEDLAPYEDRLLIATVSGIRDMNGNVLRKAVNWTFRVNQSPIYWTVPNVNYTVYQGAEESFMRVLKNAGGLDEPFTIISHPQWLTPNTINGTIPATGEQEITFTVNTQLNVAVYSDTVVVVTSSGEERLLVTLNVLHEPPTWQVSPASFTYNMNITAQVVFDDTLSRDIYDIIGVYSGNELRGVAQIEHVSAIDKYVAFITVYSNLAADEILTFRMWDASNGKEFAFFGSAYTFTSNSSLGSVSSPLILKPDASVQVVDMNPGWTWFSLNVSAGPVTLNAALKSISPSDGDLIKSQNAYSLYSEELGWQGKLLALNVGSSYQIYMKDGGSLQYTGKPVDPLQATLNLKQGWNWIAHMNQKIMDLNETLDLFPATAGDRIKSQTEFADFIAATQTWEGSLKKMLPGEGYLLKSGADATFQYPVLGKSTISYPSIPEWEIDINAFEYNMSITSVVEFDAMEMEDSTLIIAAFSGFECRGLTQIQYVPGLNKYVGFMPVYSNSASGDSVNFEVFEPSSRKKRPIAEKTVFVSDRLMGDLNTPFVLTAQPVGDELVPYQFYLSQNYPNPFNPETIIEYGLSVDGDVELSVYNTLGQKVATLVNKHQQAHHYKIAFNAADYSLATGVYFYQIKSGNFIKRRKLLFIK